MLHFGGVWSSAEVWLNGKFLGRHDSGYTSFAFDVSGKLKTDGANLLAVRVRQITKEYKFDVFDDWTLGEFTGMSLWKLCRVNVGWTIWSHRPFR